MKKYVKIDGIHCNHCIETITNKLLKNPNIKKVIIKNNIAHITYTNNLSNKKLIDDITSIGYFTKDEYISNHLKDIDTKIELKEFILIVLIILSIWFILYKILGFNIFNMIPNITSSITYGMLFITGLLTSIHCIFMCGAINLIAIIDTKKSYKKSILYNLGRLLSYTIIGALVGLIGSVFSSNNILNGIVIIIASIIMFLMSLSMLGIIDFRYNIIHKIHIKSNSSFIIGLLNGLMPCGPLQAMELYALSTGSILKGALSMFIFGLGTIPLMLFVGIFYNLIKTKNKILINKIASVLILILSLVMFNRGLLTLGIDYTKYFKQDYGNYISSKLVDNYQLIEFNLDYSNYEDIIVQKDIPVRLIIHVDEKHLTGCNNKIEISEYNIDKKLEVGDNIIEFTPTNEGIFTYTCWMHMIKNNIKVIDDKSYFKNNTNKTTEVRVPANLKEIKGEVVDATLNSDGNIVINKSDITDEVRYIDYEVDGITIGLLAVRDSKGKIMVVVNTCRSCGGAPYAYFVQDGKYIQCQNCGNKFLIDDLDKLTTDGCNPIEIEDRKDTKDTIIIGTKQLKELKSKFENWRGPKTN